MATKFIEGCLWSSGKGREGQVRGVSGKVEWTWGCKGKGGRDGGRKEGREGGIG